MKMPKMIIFDYGHTLVCEAGYDFLRGQEVLFKYIAKNKSGATAKEVNDFADKLFADHSAVREMGYELNERNFQHLIYEYYGIEFSVSLLEAEKIYWDNASPGVLMPNIEKLLEYIDAKGIRSAVISNIGWSGAALTDRINRMLPNNKFEFIIASSEYVLRKPNKLLFELAVRKADLDAGDVWYCGDKVKYDVEGSASAGIFPVWYEDLSMENPWSEEGEARKTKIDHLHIHDWQEMIDVLEGL